MLEKIMNKSFYEGYFKRNLDNKYAENLERIGRIFFIILFILTLSSFTINIWNFTEELLIIFALGHLYTILLSLTAYLSISKFQKKLNKLIKLLFFLTGIVGISFMGIFLFNGSAFYIFGVNLLLNFLVCPILFILLYTSVFKKYFEFAQVTSFILIVLGIFSLFYFIIPENLSYFFATHGLFLFVFPSLGFLFSSPKEGLIKMFCLNTSTSKLSKYIIWSVTFLVFLMLIIIRILNETTHPFNKAFILGSFVSTLVLAFIFIVIFIFAIVINENEIDKLISEKEAQKREKLFEQLISFTNDAVLVTNRDNIVIYANSKIYQYLNVKKEDLIGKNFLDDSLDMFVHKEEFIKAFETHKTQFISPHVSNENLYLSGYILPVIKEGKFNGIIQAVVDVTEFKEDESNLKSSMDLLNVLLSEVHHRVKNNMQIIISLLNLQKYQIQDDNVRNALDESKNRVKAMSLVHENLYMSKNFSQINIKEYTKLLIEDIENYYSYIPNLLIEDNVIDENIGLDTAIPLGLFINENFNGSIFYGFENGKYLKENNIPGIITIDLSKNDDYYILKISDNGSGKEPDSVGKYGITTELMESLAIQLNGDLSVNMDDGMDLILKFPIE